ncbi:hypothetical protein SAM23877_0479 [Streptomyces ambofaciens ATCC 23877]|uniref:Uncharacterized protein n=1 Tax=Streptomyces ambofaciens (strain ATCC 23877 / 3486 / DSM 40053 / JCM 4204 / NBRC 12836 / NRRL B-2516) TaxID=278992 RepID=A0A0K2AKK5_STRA7|nr:hypothetical protein SAM23877_0479 [Streptomyces ambofaciens ATCC 23877]
MSTEDARHDGRRPARGRRNAAREDSFSATVTKRCHTVLGSWQCSGHRWTVPEKGPEHVRTRHKSRAGERPGCPLDPP